ncbi:MAG: hypothetical protein H5U40_00420 [Polyangiaceae bacterium]|nr:hypothetical protein [Polyangiaceae bacterium]
MLLRYPLVPALVLVLSAAQSASAQDVPPSEATATTPQAGSSASPSEPLIGDEQALYEEQVGTEERYGRAHPHEEPGRGYNFLGAFYRHHFLPRFIPELFLDAAPSENFPQFGVEFTHRKNGFDVIASIYYADFSGSGPVLAKGDPLTDVEWFDSELYAVMGGVTFLWGTQFSDWFAIQYGLGVGVGALLGDLRRTEAYPTTNGYARCVTPTAPGLPGSAQADVPFDGSGSVSDYCGAPNSTTTTTDADSETGEHYGVRAERWLDGGSVPNLWFRFAPQISLRIKPMHHLLFRIDGGFDVFSGFFVGGAAAVGF